MTPNEITNAWINEASAIHEAAADLLGRLEKPGRLREEAEEKGEDGMAPLFERYAEENRDGVEDTECRLIRARHALREALSPAEQRPSRM